MGAETPPNHSLFGNGVPRSHLTGPAFSCCRSEAFVHGASPFVLQIWLSTILWLSMAWVEPGHTSLGGCWILAQRGMGGACLRAGFWLSMARVEPGHASLEGAGTVWRSLRPPATSRASYLSVL